MNLKALDGKKKTRINEVIRFTWRIWVLLSSGDKWFSRKSLSSERGGVGIRVP